jgi:hypothetical protein
MSFRSAISGRFVSKLWAKLCPWLVIRHRMKPRDFKIGGTD